MKPQLIPFGKYKGQPIEELMSDPQYCEWLMEQPWFAARYPAICTVIVNNFGEPAETPEHNQLQTLFLDTDFCQRLILKTGIVPKKFNSWKQEALNCLRDNLSSFEHTVEEYRSQLEIEKKYYHHHLETKTEKGLSSTGYYDDEYYNRKILELDAKKQSHEANIAQVNTRIETLKAAEEGPTVSVMDVAFETQGADVRIHWRMNLDDWCNNLSGYLSYRLSVPEGLLYVECKPSIGDDYPAILRKIILVPGAGLHRVPYILMLLIGDGGYCGIGATLDQVKAIFASRGVQVVLKSEIE